MKLVVHSIFVSSFALLVAGCCATAPVAPPPPPPDQDGDGIVDADDQCPAVAGLAKFGGCIDSDDDGLPDNTDQCPNEKGDVEHRGCVPPLPPDTDADGIIDENDKCPNEAGKRRTGGCPDNDNDGVANGDDKCPDQAGSAQFEGCLPPEAQRFTGAIKGINFDAGKAVVKKTSYKLLDDAVALLEHYPELRLEIQGHTDDQGPDDANMKLSQERAEAVRAYMLGKGVAENRIVAVGYGESKPIADNKTGAGRAKNRRMEFRLLGQE